MPFANGRLPKHRATERIIEETIRRLHAGIPENSGAAGSSSTPTGPYVPMRIFAGYSFIIPENTQICAAFPIVIDAGAVLDVAGALAMVT